MLTTTSQNAPQTLWIDFRGVFAFSDTAMDKEKKLAEIANKIEEAKKAVFTPLQIFLVTLGTESERSAVVLGAERVNVSLENNLKKFLRPCPDDDDPLFSASRPLGTFSGKIELAYRLGLIDLKFKQALNMVRKLRNDFAHAITVETLQEGKHASRVAALFALMKTEDDTVMVMASVFTNAAKEGGKKIGDKTANYLGCIMVLLMKLEMASFHLGRPDVEIPAKIDYRDPD